MGYSSFIGHEKCRGVRTGYVRRSFLKKNDLCAVRISSLYYYLYNYVIPSSSYTLTRSYNVTMMIFLQALTIFTSFLDLEMCSFKPGIAGN